MANPLVSVIIPCYNMGNYLSETIKSVEKVINPELHEVIIVDDGSTENNTLNILNNIKSHQVVRQKNGGLSNARNTGISLSKGKYLIFLDSDNLLTDSYLTKGVAILEANKEVDIVYGDSEVFGEGHGFLNAKPYDLQTLMSYNYIDACCLIRKKIFDDLGGFDESMKTGYEDWEMWLRAGFNRKRFYYLEGVIIQKYRIRKDSMLNKIDKRKRDAIFDYLSNKYPSFLNFSGVSDFYYEKFRAQTLGWTTKLFLKKYFPSLYKSLVGKGKLSKYL